MSNPIPSPPPCGVGRDIKLKDKAKNFKGPWKFNTVMKQPVSKKDFIRSRGMAALDKPIPKEFSWRKIGGDKIENGDRNQGSCGSCWAVASASVLGDRYAIKYNIKAPYPSAAWTLSCAARPGTPTESICAKGDNPYYAGLYFEKNGIKSETCWPYAIVSNGNDIATPCLSGAPENCCLSCCGNDNGSDVVFTAAKGSTSSIIALDADGRIDPIATTAAIQREIMTSGPVTASFYVPPNFTDWWMNNAGTNRTFIPSKPTSESIFNGGHSVALTGWGVDSNGVRFWELRNSWGSPGYCQYAFGLDTDQRYWTGIDFPLQIGAGGVLVFSPGPEPKGMIPSGTKPPETEKPNFISSIQVFISDKIGNENFILGCFIIIGIIFAVLITRK